MKKLISLFALVFAIGMASAQFTTPRFGSAANEDNTGRTITYWYSTPAAPYTGTQSVYQNVSNQTIQAIYTSSTSVSATLNANITNCHALDIQTFVFRTAATTTVVATFGTGYKPKTATTTVLPSSRSIIQFFFDGVEWVEEWRAENE